MVVKCQREGLVHLVVLVMQIILQLLMTWVKVSSSSSATSASVSGGKKIDIPGTYDPLSFESIDTDTATYRASPFKLRGSTGVKPEHDRSR